MALPQNPNGITAGDRELLEASVAQSKNLAAQTKVLHKLSDNIKDQKKEYSKLRDDIKELRKGFYTGDNKGFAEIKKYFEKSRDTNRFVSRSKLGTEDKDKEQKGFFRSAISKLFGPSKYQQKMMDDTSEIRRLTELFQEDINFIKREYEEPARARERELLAQAIADKIGKNGEGGSSGGGILSALGTAVGFLVKELADIFKNVVGNIVEGIAGVIKKIIDDVAKLLESLLDWTKKGVTNAQNCCSSQPRIDVPEKGQKGGDRNIPNSGQQRIPGGQQGQLPGQSQPQIGNEQRQIGYDKPEKTIKQRMDERMNRSGGISDAEPKPTGGQGKPTPGRMSGGKIAAGGIAGIGLGIAGVLAANENPGIEDQYGAMKFLDDKIDAAVNKGKDMVKSVSGKIPPRYKDYNMGTGVDPDAALSAVKKDYIAEGFAERLKETFEKVTDYVDEEIGHKFAAASKNFLNTVGELDINGEKINLFPNLGTATATVLNSVAEQTKDLVMGGIDMGKNATNFISNQVNNVSSGGASAPIVLPSASSVNTRPEIQQMLMGGVVIGGRRYH